MAQAILESGWFHSSACRNKHNLFRLTNPRTGKYYEFNYWTESVQAYYTKVQYKYKGGNYLFWLDEIGYAENQNCVKKTTQVLPEFFRDKQTMSNTCDKIITINKDFIFTLWHIVPVIRLEFVINTITT